MGRWEEEQKKMEEERKAAVAELERKRRLAEKVAGDFWKVGMCACKMFGDDSWPRGYGPEDTRKHRKGCPRDKITQQQGMKLLQPIADHIVELEEKVLKLHEKAAGAEGPFDPVAVPVASRVLALGRAHQSEYPDELSGGIIQKVALGMGARFVSAYKWKSDYYDRGRGVPENEPNVRELMEPDPTSQGRKGEQTERPVVVGDHGNISYYAIFPNEQRAKVFVELATMFRSLTLAAFNAGMDRGRSIITQLAAGEITMAQFARMSEDFEKEPKER